MKRLFFMAVIGLLSFGSMSANVADEEVTTIRCHLTIYYSDWSVMVRHFDVASAAHCQSYAYYYNN